MSTIEKYHYSNSPHDTESIPHPTPSPEMPMADVSSLQTSMDKPIMEEILKIAEPLSEFAILVDQSQVFGSHIESSSLKNPFY